MPERIIDISPSIGPGKPGILSGAMVGVMLTVSLIAVFYLAWRLAGLPFVAFDVFDWLARTLPGAVIAFGIDTMVSVIRALHLGPTAETAKIAEKTMAVAGLLVTGAMSGAVLFALLRAFRGNYAPLFGPAIGAAVVGALVVGRRKRDDTLAEWSREPSLGYGRNNISDPP